LLKNKMEQIRKEVKTLMKTLPPTHDWMHVERVIQNALHIAKVEGADMEIVELSAILHDIAREKDAADTETGDICHAVEGAKMAEEILKRYNYSEDKIKKICHCVRTHRFRDEEKPETLEAKVLYDADKLDVIGAIGVARAYSFAGEHNQRLYSDFTIKPEIEKVVYHSTHTPVKEFQVKLSKIKDKLLTGEGRRMAQERHSFMVNFYSELEKEIKGEI